MRSRPTHLMERQVVGDAFGTTCTLIRTTGSRNTYGEYTEVETPSPIYCATAPVESKDPRARLITEGGIQLDAARLFWTIEAVQPVTENASGDLILYDGERYRATEVQPWGNGFTEIMAVRQELQAPIADQPNELERLLRAFIATGAGIPSERVIPGNGKGPRPREFYASLLLDDDTREGYPIHQDNDDGGVDSLQYRKAVYTLHIYRAGALRRALDFATYAESPNGLTAAEDLGFRIVWPLSHQRADDVVGDAYEEGAEFSEFTVTYSHATHQVTPVVETNIGTLAVDQQEGVLVEQEIRHGP